MPSIRPFKRPARWASQFASRQVTGVRVTESRESVLTSIFPPLVLSRWRAGEQAFRLLEVQSRQRRFGTTERKAVGVAEGSAISFPCPPGRPVQAFRTRSIQVVALAGDRLTSLGMPTKTLATKFA